MSLVFLIAGLVLVVAGAEIFFDGLVSTARTKNLPPFVLTLVVSGFELENLAAGIAANVRGLGDAAAGTFRRIGDGASRRGPVAGWVCGSDRDCDLSSYLSGFKAAHGLGHLGQGVGLVDERGEPTGLDELAKRFQVGVV